MADLDHMRYMIPSLERLRDMGFAPDQTLDVGAGTGAFVAVAKHVWPGTRVTCVEANLACGQSLRNTEAEEIRLECLSGEGGPRTYWSTTLDPASAGNSLFREMMPGFSDEHAIPNAVETTTLNRLFPDRRFDLVKVDTQGSENEIIYGGRRVIEAADVVIVEMSLIQYNRGAPRIEQVVWQMTRLGFALVDLMGPSEGGHWYNGRKTQVDGVFVRRIGRLAHLYEPRSD